MRHNVAIKPLGKDSKHRKSMLNNLASDLIKHERIKTTRLKAKELRPFVEKIIHRGKTDTLHNRREVYKKIKSTTVLKKLFEDIGKRFETRTGGYTRIYRLGRRKGDGAELAIIELVEELLVNTSEDKPKKDKASTKKETPESKSETEVVNDDPEVKEKTEEKESNEAKVEDKAEEEVKAEKAEAEDAPEK